MGDRYYCAAIEEQNEVLECSPVAVCRLKILPKVLFFGEAFNEEDNLLL